MFGIAFLFLLLAGVLSTSLVQTKLANWAVKELLKTHDVVVDVHKVDIAQFSKINLEGLYISDLQKDTLLYINSLNISLEEWTITPLSLRISYAELDSVNYYLTTAKGDTTTNMQFMLDQFSTNTLDTTHSAFDIQVDNLSLNDVDFIWNNQNYLDTGYGVNYDHLYVKELSGNFERVVFNENSITSIINQLRFREKSGFELNELNAIFKLSNNAIVFDSLLIKANETYVSGKYTMYHNNYNAFSDYVSEVKMVAFFDSSNLSSSDIGYFVPIIEHLNKKINFKGEFRGTASDFSIKNFLLNYETATFLAGNFSLEGLPDLDKLQINLDLRDGFVSKLDVKNIPLFPFNKGTTVQLPNALKELNYTSVKGTYKGTFVDFELEASLKTNLGVIRTNVDVAHFNKVPSYNVSLSFNNLKIATFLDHTDLDIVSGSLNLKGIGNTLNTADILADGKIFAFDYKGYRYRNIKLNGNIKDHLFVGNVDIDDKYCELDFDGRLDFTPQNNTYKFNLQIDTLYPVLLGYYDRDSSTFFKGNASIDFIGHSLDTSTGYANFSQIFYAEKDSSFSIDTLTLKSFVNGRFRTLKMHSTFGDLALKGDASLQGLDKVAATILNKAVPTYFSKITKKLNSFGGISGYVSFNENLNKISSVFLPEFRIDSSLEIRTSLFSNPSVINFSVESQGLHYLNYAIDSVELVGGCNDSLFSIHLVTDSIKYGEAIKLDNVNLRTDFSNDSVNFHLDYLNSKSHNYSSELNLKGKIKGYSQVEFSVKNAYLEIADSIWSFSNNNYIDIDTTAIEIKNLEVSSYEKYIKLNGILSKQPTDTIELEFNALNLSNLGRILNREDMNLEGIISGKIKSKNTFSNPNLFTNISIDRLSLNKILIGTGTLDSQWDNDLRRAGVNFDLVRLPDTLIPDTIHSLTLTGFVYPDSTNQLDLELGTEGLYLKTLEPFTKSFMDSLDGKITGSIDVLGQFSSPKLQGAFDILDTRFRVKYLNTTYYAKNEKLRIENGWFGFDNLQLIDQFGSKASALATVYHNKFQNFNYDVNIEMKDFLVLNTNKYLNDLYYGTGFLNGNINLSGYDQMFFIELKAKTAKQSNFIIPLYGSEEVGQSDFITFVDASGNSTEVEKKAVDLSGIEMTFDLEIEPTTQVKMMFDESGGDQLAARGLGNLKLEINSDGNFGMYGKYRVSSGSYKFTYGRAFSKKFTLEDGGTILWNGDPLNAVLDLTAIYSVRAPLGVILNDSTLTNKVNNECLMKMSENLSKPKIDFEIRLPNASPGISQQVASQLSTPEEVNKQVFSLLLFNRYASPKSGLSVDGIGGATTSDLLSNQINNWISKLDNQLFDIGVSEIKSDEVEIELSKKLLDDRLIIESNVGLKIDSENSAEESTGHFVGDFTIEYLITQSGKVRGKVFNRTENQSRIENLDGANAQTQGVGIVLREDFDSAKELWNRIFRKRKSNP